MLLEADELHTLSWGISGTIADIFSTLEINFVKVLIQAF